MKVSKKNADTLEIQFFRPVALKFEVYENRGGGA